MGIVNNALAGASGNQGYNIDRSLRFRSSASAYLSRTPASSANRQVSTFSAWVKWSLTGSSPYPVIFGAAPNGSTYRDGLYFNGSNLTVLFNGGVSYMLTTSQVFRDPSAWYHIVLAIDTTQATAANRVKLYVNGSQVTAFSTANYPTQNYDPNFNSAIVHNLGRSTDANDYFDGYLAEVNFIDGQALTPSSFGETSTETGVWVPKKYTGTYGTNGFYLDFKDNTSATTLAYDKSGNGNNWTANNISTTTGATYDSMTDVPTLTSATAANYCVLNPLMGKLTSTSNGNLQVDGSTGSGQIRFGTMAIPASGKFYWEITASNAFQANIGVGCVLDYNGGFLGTGASSATYYYAGNTSVNGSATTSISAYTNGDVIGIALDAATGRIWFAKNGTWQNSGDPAAGTGYLGAVSNTYDYFPASGSAGTQTYSHVYNFGQRPFSYTPPTGFKALNTFNLPDPVIKKPNQYMDVKVRTGAGAASSVTGIGFQPDFVWVKDRTAAQTHGLFDSVRGVQNLLQSNATAAELTSSGYLTAFNSDGYSFGSGTQFLNANTDNYVDWLWKKGATPGFDIVTYTGNGSNRTISHNLGVAPSMMIVKRRDSSASGWIVYHKYSRSDSYDTFMVLNSTDAVNYEPTAWNSTTPTSSVFSLGTYAGTNANTGTFVNYLFAEIPGFSKFGSYTANDNADGPYVYLGFRPKFILFKCTTLSGEYWSIFDTSRDTYNISKNILFPNLSNAENSSYPELDIVSNGFKIRANGINSYINTGTNTYIYAAFAENPFKYSLAR